ncbi:MAG: universal stress protein [Euryarchaeota archaeon]|nr:universal stress protein [Euryarchaeota archaeon]
MIARVLVAMDGSEMAEHALEFALENYPDAEIAVLTVVGVPTWFMGEAAGLVLADDPSKAAESRAETVLQRAHELAAEYDAEINTIVALGTPSREILTHAESYDMVIVGGHGRDLGSRLLLGNVAALVTRRSPVPVTVVR